MSTFSSKFTTRCYYSTDGVFCKDGFLQYYRDSDSPVLLEGQPVTCPACHGRGALLTEAGEDLLEFFTVYLRPRMQEMVRELLEEHER